MLENKFTRYNEVEHTPDLRCEAATSTGPCGYVKVPGTKYCPRHGGNRRIAEKQVTNYQLTQWRAKVESGVNSPGIKTLSEEIAIMRLVLETILNSCRTDSDLIMYSQRIATTVASIERLVVAFDKLEQKMGQMLNKAAILQFASTVVEIISSEVDDANVIEKISDKIITAISELGVNNDN